MDTSGVDQERSTAWDRALFLAKAAQAACLHVEWEAIGQSYHTDHSLGFTTVRALLQCPACGLMRWADEEVPRG
jgi:hypothetical protein